MTMEKAVRKGISTFAMVGAGRVAWHLSQAMAKAGYEPLCVYSRTLANAATLAERLKCPAVDDLEQVPLEVDAIVIAIKDDAIADVAARLCPARAGSLFIHTAGSVSIDVFSGLAKRYGVMYPMQSFSKERKLDFRKIPIFVEGNDEPSLSAIRGIAESISDVSVINLSSADRKRMHLAAVFASNFTNHCYAQAAELLRGAGVPFSALLPLIDETCAKVHEMPPRDAQTGPAVRYDQRVMAAHESMLTGDAREIYRCMSRSIHHTATDSQKQDNAK